MSDLVTVYNRALAQAGSRRQLSEPTQAGAEGDQCRLFYPIVRDVVQRSAAWPSCKAYTRLAVLKERDFSLDWAESGPSPGYRFAYAEPSEMLAPRYLHSYARFEWETYEANGSRAIMTNCEQGLLYYTRRQDNIGQWDVNLQQAIIYTLAASIVGPLTGKTGKEERLREQAISIVSNAQTEIANASDDVEEALPPWLTVRGFTDPPHTSRFFFPVENFNGVVA